jgi:hypothetical protein
MSSDKKSPSALAQIASLQEQNLGYFSQHVGSTPNETQYFSALGKFVAEYALTESTIHQLARRFSGLSDAKARIIFGKMRIGDIIDCVKQMMQVDEIDTKIHKLVSDCLLHFKDLSKTRGRLVHRSTYYEPQGLFGIGGGHLRVSNFAIVKDISQTEEEVFTLKDLEDMMFDCTLILLRLESIRNPDFLKNKTDEQKSFLQVPWRYKFSQPNTLVQMHQNNQTKKSRKQSNRRSTSSQSKL